MKRIIFAISLVVALCLLFSCAKMSQPENIEESLETGTLDLYVTVEDTSPVTQGGRLNPLKTIAPNQITNADLQAYTLELTATSLRQNTIQENITLANNGRTTLPNIPFGTWHLKLEAQTQNGDTVLEAFSAVTIDYVEPVEVEFILRPVKGGSGSVNVTFNLNPTDFANLTGSKVEIGLYNPIDYKPVTGSEQSPTLARTLPYNPQSIPAGEYVLRLTITAGNGGTLKQGAFVTYSDRITVEATRISEATITLTQMFQKPTAPINPTFTNNGATATGATRVSLTWGHVFNANSYELQVLEYTGTTVPTNNTNWAIVSGDTNSKLVTYNAEPNDPDNYLAHTNKYESQYYLDGGLLPGQTNIRLGLEIGTKGYAARMKAVNYYGDSEWVYFPSPNPAIPTITPPTAPTDFDFTTGYYDATSESFTASFTWNDANNEDGYEMQLMRISKDTATPRKNDAWERLVTSGSGSNVTTYDGNNIGSSGGNPSAYEGGSLLADSTRLRLSMKRLSSEYYVVRLRSYNAGGSSTWVYPPAPKLLLPVSRYDVTTTPVHSNQSGGQVYDAGLTIQDITGNGFTYQYEWIAPSNGDLSPLFTAQDKDAAWVALGGTRRDESTSTQITVSDLNVNTPFSIRVRTVVKRNGQVVDYTPWYYHLKAIIQAP